MHVAAYCGQDWARAMRASTGVQPGTSPPLESGGGGLVNWLALASIADVLALNLHGFEHQSVYYGQAGNSIGPTALTIDDVLTQRWDGVTIFLEVCFSAGDNLENHAIPAAFYAQGARAVIGSRNEAYGRVRGALPLPGLDGEADRLLNLFLFWMRRGKSPIDALELAKRTFKIWSWPLDREDRATLDSFTIIER